MTWWHALVLVLAIALLTAGVIVEGQRHGTWNPDR